MCWSTSASSASPRKIFPTACSAKRMSRWCRARPLATTAPFASATRPVSTSLRKVWIGCRISAGRSSNTGFRIAATGYNSLRLYFLLSGFRFPVSAFGVNHLALILHAHLPFVRHPEHEHFLEEDWLFEAITETYIPLLQMMQRLVNDNVRFKLTMSLTPTLCAMLRDELLRKRYIRHVDLLIDLAAR